MKVISKFQDFYEFDCYRYGEPAPDPIWHRVEEEKEIQVDDKIAEKINSLFLCKDHSLKYDYTGKYNFRRNNSLESVDIESQIIGIYPYTYYIPKVYFNKIVENDDLSTKDIFKTKKEKIYLSAEDSMDILTIKDSFKDIMSKYGVSYKDFCYPDDIVISGKRNSWAIRNTRREAHDKSNMITKFPELFDIVGEPIISFSRGIDGLFNKWKKYSLKIKVNENLSKTDLLSYYPEIITERDVYTELENYLIARHQEPISEPDNKTKITSHGFDLKTSFRNM